MERAVSQMLTKLVFVQDSTSGNMKLQSGSLAEFEKITQENIELDLTRLLDSAINTEVINQRKMAKQQYLESQGFSSPAQQAMPTQQVNPMGMNPQNIQGGNMGMGMNNAMNQQAMAMNNGSGYPVPPAGYDQMNNAYWIDPATGQMTYTPPTSGLGLGAALTKGVAWAKWLA